MSIEEFKERLAAERCICGHTRGRHTYYGECGVDFVTGSGQTLPCLCTRFELKRGN